MQTYQEFIIPNMAPAYHERSSPHNTRDYGGGELNTCLPHGDIKYLLSKGCRFLVFNAVVVRMAMARSRPNGRWWPGSSVHYWSGVRGETCQPPAPSLPPFCRHSHLPSTLQVPATSLLFQPLPLLFIFSIRLRDQRKSEGWRLCSPLGSSDPRLS